jgi:hypothetical protein
MMQLLKRRKVVIDKTDEEIIEILADGNHRARLVLQKVSRDIPESFKTLAIDLQDMQMSGVQIIKAYEMFARSKTAFFVQACSRREQAMVDMVNELCRDKMARQHGPQKTLSKIDEAVSGIMEEASKNNVLTRIDEGADAIHGLFKTMLNEMQRSRVFVSKFRLNLDGAGWAVFQFALVQLQHPDGTPYAIQPMDEVAGMKQPTGIETGRTSSAEPNESNIPQSKDGVNNDLTGTTGAIDGSAAEGTDATADAIPQ